MATVNTLDKRKKIIFFSLILLAIAGIELFLMVSYFKRNSVSKVSTSTDTYKATAESVPVNYDMLLNTTDVLSGRLSSLQQLDQQYADVLTASGNKGDLDTINKQIYVQEEIFRGTLDSIYSNRLMQSSGTMDTLINDIVASYRAILENRHSTGILRNAATMGKSSFTPDQLASLKVQKELQEKNDRIAALESSVKALNAERARLPMRQEPESTDNNLALKASIAAQENRITSLTNSYNAVKQENDRLQKLQSDASKASSSSEQFYRSKTSTLQQRIDELSAELSLARVDCNLSRADAGMIISNARQRKELLSEASAILTTLSKSDDADIKRKVQDKINRLNQVAANSRD